MAQLQVGTARADVTPPVPIDLVGYLRRCAPAVDVRSPLEAVSMVFDDGSTRIVVVAVDVLLFSPDHADRLREQIAEATDTAAERVLLNTTHTHAGPTTARTDVSATRLGPLKFGGEMDKLTEAEAAWIDLLPHHLVSVARRAVAGLRPARLGGGVGHCSLGVNRRERTDDGRTILGWNPEGPIDRDVSVLRVDAEDGDVLGTIVVYGCHPVVTGPDDPAINADYPYFTRRQVERIIGGTCVFLMGAAGNVLPLEGFFDHPGEEERFGAILGTEAASVASRTVTGEVEYLKQDYGSVTPISLYRRTQVGSGPSIGARARRVTVPLKGVPTLDEAEEELVRYRADLERAERDGADGTVLNPIRYHLTWAERLCEELRSGSPRPEVEVVVQAFRLGDVGLVALPGEAFAELSIAIKAGSPATTTAVAGYSNGLVSYLPSAAEYPFGGYEVDYCHHGFGLVEQLAPDSERVFVETSLELLRELFD